MLYLLFLGTAENDISNSIKNGILYLQDPVNKVSKKNVRFVGLI